jgi:hypothetical protein
VFIARAVCGLTHVTVAALCCSCSLLCVSENEAGQSVSVNDNEEPAGKTSPVQFSCNCNYSLITHNKTPVHSIWGLLSVYVVCRTPRLNLSSELRPSGNNVQDTFPTGSAQDITKLPVFLHICQVEICRNYSNYATCSNPSGCKRKISSTKLLTALQPTQPPVQ